MELFKLASIFSLDIILLTETWLHSGISENELLFGSSYLVAARSDRLANQHGGLAILVRNNLNMKFTDLSCRQYDFSLCLVSHSSYSRQLFILLYLPDNYSSYAVPFDSVSQCIHHYLHGYYEYSTDLSIANLPSSIYLLGDFNFPGISWCNETGISTNEKYFLELISDIDLRQIIAEPTHVRGNILDLILTNDDQIKYSIHPDMKFSDHFPIIFDCRIDHHLTVPCSRFSFSKSNFDIVKFNCQLTSFYEFISKITSYDENYFIHWFDQLTHAITSSLPLKRSKRVQYPIYFSSHSIHLINKRSTLLRKLHRQSSVSNLVNLNRINSDLNNSIELDKVTFVDSFNLDSKLHCYSIIRSLRSNSSFPNSMKFNSKSASNLRDITALFNDYFCSVFQPIESSVDFSSAPPPQSTSLPPICLSKCSFSVDDIIRLLEKLPDTLSHGSDKIPSFVLKSCSTILGPLFYHLYHGILKLKSWPHLWKCALITPLHKSGNKVDVTNYRPISILCKASLIFERILFDYLYSKVNHLFAENQHGFIKRRSTCSQMLTYLNELYNLKDCSIPCVAIYFDIQKAFDSVPHSKLLYKLHHVYNLDNDFIDLISSYLSGRTQCVRISGVISESLPVTSGVPQGSVLGPLLFILYMNDIIESLQFCEHFIYCDDLKILSMCSQLEIQSDLNHLHNWSVNNCMIFHPNKCKFISFNGYDAELLLGDVSLDKVDTFVDLGVTISNNLDWTLHIDSRIAKCNAIFNIIKRNVPYSISVHSKLCLYKSLILSTLLYCSQVWYPNAQSMVKLEKFQQRCVKWIKLSVEPYSHVLTDLNLLPISLLRTFYDLTLLWKIMNDKIDCPVVNKTTSLISTRSCSVLFQLPATKKFKSRDNFYYRVPRIANELLSLGIINFNSSIAVFKENLRSYLIFKTAQFNINNFCSYHVKCLCSTCRS